MAPLLKAAKPILWPSERLVKEASAAFGYGSGRPT
jgi:hypothetical protein